MYNLRLSGRRRRAQLSKHIYARNILYTIWADVYYTDKKYRYITMYMHIYVYVIFARARNGIRKLAAAGSAVYSENRLTLLL